MLGLVEVVTIGVLVLEVASMKRRNFLSLIGLGCLGGVTVQAAPRITKVEPCKLISDFDWLVKTIKRDWPEAIIVKVSNYRNIYIGYGCYIDVSCFFQRNGETRHVRLHKISNFSKEYIIYKLGETKMRAVLTTDGHKKRNIVPYLFLSADDKFGIMANDKDLILSYEDAEII